MKIQSLAHLPISENCLTSASSASACENTAFSFETENRLGVFQSVVRGRGNARHAPVQGITTRTEADTALNEAEQIYNQARNLVESDRTRSLALTEQALTLVNQVGRFHNNTPHVLTREQQYKLNELMTGCISLRNQLQPN